jgi:hypothetical protein
MRTDVYDKITNQIVAELEKGGRPWHKPWNAEHAAGRITRPLRANGIAYQGINVLMLWSAAMEKGYAAPIWMTFKQALELKARVRGGEHGSLVVYADKIIRTETDTDTGEESEHAIPFMKGYTVFTTRNPRRAPRPWSTSRMGDRRHHPPRRHDGLLQRHARLRADAALRELHFRFVFIEKSYWAKPNCLVSKFTEIGVSLCW